MRPTVLPLSLLALLLAALGALAAEATAPVGTADRIHGAVEGAGETHELTFFAPAGTKLATKVGADKGGADPQATLSLSGPAGPVDLIGGKGVLADTGDYTIEVAAGPGRSGAYVLDVKGKAPSGVKPVFDLAPDEELDLPFGAFAGTAFSFKLKGAEAVSLTDPDLGVAPLSGTSGSRTLDADGGYVLRIRGAGGPGKATLRTKAPKAAKRELWLAPPGAPEAFGPAPTIASVVPAEGLMGAFAADVEIRGGGISAEASVSLAIRGATVPGVISEVLTEGDDVVGLVADFDLTAAAAGSAVLTVGNPSGATATAKFAVVKPDKVALPPGVIDDTEVWRVEFTDGFGEALELFGLRGDEGQATLNANAAAAVKSYVLYFLRAHFGADGRTGRLPKSGTAPAVSFVLGEIPDLAGEVGADYNRLVIGGEPGGSDPSDNPDLPWGFVPVDAGNAQVDDVSDASAGNAFLPVAAMDPADTGRTTAGFREAFADLLDTPLRPADLPFFGIGYLPADAEVERMGIVIDAVERLGREIGAVAAHHVGRAMGLSNGDWEDDGTLSGTPGRFGEFSAERIAGFTEDELAALEANARPSALPGRSGDLTAYYFGLVPTTPYLLPEAKGGVAYEQAIGLAGGKPDREEGDLTIAVLGGSIPAGHTLTADLLLSGTAPFFDPGYSVDYPYHRPFEFGLEITDGWGSGFWWAWRLNLVLDPANPWLTPANGWPASRVATENQRVRDTAPGDWE